MIKHNKTPKVLNENEAIEFIKNGLNRIGDLLIVTSNTKSNHTSIIKGKYLSGNPKNQLKFDIKNSIKHIKEIYKNGGWVESLSDFSDAELLEFYKPPNNQENLLFKIDYLEIKEKIKDLNNKDQIVRFTIQFLYNKYLKNNILFDRKGKNKNNKASKKINEEIIPAIESFISNNNFWDKPISFIINRIKHSSNQILTKKSDSSLRRYINIALKKRP